MITVVYFEDDGRNVMVAAFLMRSDAESFVEKALGGNHYKVTDIDGHWGDWFNIKDCISQQAAKESKHED